MTTVRRLEIRIDQTGNAEEGISSLSKGLSGLATPVGMAVAGLGALSAATIGAGSFLVSLGSDAEEMQGKFDVVFGEGATAAAAALDEFGNSVGRNKFQLMEMASSIQDTFVPLGFARDSAAGLSIQLTELAVDVASFNNEVESDVLASFQSALVGNHDAVMKYGIVINEATLNQELLNMGIEGGTKAASEQEKVQARLNLIMQGTTDAQGDAERTSGSFANQMRALKAELSEAATAMGIELLPMVTEALKQFTPWVKEVLPQAVQIFKDFAGNLNSTVGPAMLIINDSITRMAQAFGVNTDEVTSADVILKVLKTTLDLVVIAVQTTAVGMSLLADGVESVRNGVNSAIDGWNRFRDAVRSAVDAIPDWLIPGSPTPFEIGLRGIADATGQASKQLADAFNIQSTPTLAAAGVSSANDSVVVNLTYSPVISLGNQAEAQTQLLPFITEGIRQAKLTGVL